MGRPTIVAVSIRCRVVRIHRARRTIRVVRIDAETESRFSKPVFQPCSGRIQRSLSQCRTCPLHMDFYFLFKCSEAGAVCEKTAHNTEAAAGVRLHRTLRGWGLHPRCTRLQPVAPSSQQNLGRPTKGAESSRSRIVRKHRTRRTNRVVRIVPKTESRSLMHCKVASVAIVIEVYVTALAT